MTVYNGNSELQTWFFTVYVKSCAEIVSHIYLTNLLCTHTNVVTKNDFRMIIYMIKFHHHQHAHLLALSHIYLYMCQCKCLHVDCICVWIWLFHICSYVNILHFYVRYDYVQCCEDTISVELCYINYIYYYHHYIKLTLPWHVQGFSVFAHSQLCMRSDILLPTCK